MPVSEAQLQQQVAEYLIRQYPDVMFHSDFGSGIKLTPGQAVKQKRQNGGRRAWPDMFIAEPSIWLRQDSGDWERLATLAEITKRSKEFADHRRHGYWDVNHGLFLELKKEGTRLKKKNGDWATEHIAEQSGVLEDLSKRGYQAAFAVGFEQAKKIIDEYLGGKNASSE